MTKYREILRMKSLGISQRSIAATLGTSRNTVSDVVKQAEKHHISWPLNADQTDAVLDELFHPKQSGHPSNKRIPNYDHIHKELIRNGVSKKLLWMEYLEECHQAGEDALMYSQFCFYIQQDEQKRRATMHINRKPGEQVEVDWAGDPAHLIDRVTGESIAAYVFVGVMTYSQYAYAEAFLNEKQESWITAHNHMYHYFGGVAKILVPDNCKTAVVHNRRWDDPRINETYSEMAEHYGVAIIPARVRAPKDKPNAEGSVRNISTWIIAALRDEQFFSLADLNATIHKKLEEYNAKPFTKKEGSRLSLFRNEESALLAPLPTTPYEIAQWKQATVQYHYHISVDGMSYSVPYEYLKKVVDVRITDRVIEIFYNHSRIASHKRIYGRKGQYSTVIEHMPEDHQKYIEWNGDYSRSRAHLGRSSAQPDRASAHLPQSAL